LAWPEAQLDAGGNGCDQVTLQPGWYENLFIMDGRYEVYDLPVDGTGALMDPKGWMEVLIRQRFEEQSSNYACANDQNRSLGNVPTWTSDTMSPPTGSASSAAPAVQPTVVPTTAPKATTAPTQAVQTVERRATGQNATLTFKAGEAVYGWKIVMGDKVCDRGECYLPSAPAAGQVTSGVVNPWPNEVPASTKVWKP